MKICPHCHASTPVDGKFCQQCGKPIDASPIAATMVLSEDQIASRTTWQQALDINVMFASRSSIVLGRAPDCDYRVTHPTVSKYHAKLERGPDGLVVRDLGSANGVWIDGHRVGAEGRAVREGDRVGIGPVLLMLRQGMLQSLDSSQGLRLEARRLVKEVPLAAGGKRKLLDDINLVVNPGEFVSLLGPSGSGKSTLMDCLNGRRRATGGKVLANGQDFYKHLDSFRQSLGYVPQKDIVHTALSVERALLYTAQLRLPPDLQRQELHERIESVIKQMELDKHRGTLIGNLSGGQIKRVSLGAELLAEPALLYIDEATSGLDAGTEARMMRLFRRLADQGRSILCITHNVDNVDQGHLVIVLAQGKLLYYGPPHEAPTFFGARRISDIYDRISARPVDDWHQDYLQSSQYAEFVRNRLLGAASVKPVQTVPEPSATNQAPEPQKAEPAPSPGSGLSGMLLANSRKLVESFQPLAEHFRALGVRKLQWRELTRPVRTLWNQLAVLTRRYVDLIAGDRRGLRLLVLQAPILAFFLLVGFVGKNFTAPMPLLRPITDQERRALELLQGMNDILDSKKAMSPEQQRALGNLRLAVAGMPTQMDGNQVVGVLRHLHGRDLSERERVALEGIEFTFPIDGKPTTVNAREVVEAWKHFQATGLPEQLLHLEGDVIPKGQGINPRYTYVLLFTLVMIVLWIGCNNAAKEIVKEEPIYSRERAVNLGIAPYLASKFLVLSGITVGHVFLLMLCIYGPLELLAWALPGYTVPPAQHMLGYAWQFLVLSLLGATGVALGLLLSACVSTADRANALLPYVLIPQMILGGGILAVNTGVLHWLAVTLSPVYWGYRAVRLGASQIPEAFPGYANYPDDLSLPCLALGIQLVVLLALTWVFLKQKDL